MQIVAYDILKFVLFFWEDLSFHVNCLLDRQFTWNVKPNFLLKKKYKKVLSGAVAISA